MALSTASVRAAFPAAALLATMCWHQAVTADSRAPDVERLGTPEAIGESGALRLSSLRAGDAVLRPEPGSVSDLELGAYWLPADAAQGSDWWYLLDFHFGLVPSPDTAPGSVVVSASTNGRTAAQVRFRIVLAAGRPFMQWESYDLVDGSRRYTTTARQEDVRIRNYLQTDGVRPGANSVEARIEISEGVRVERLTVYDDSGVLRSRVGPSSVDLGLLSGSFSPKNGRADVMYRLEHEGGLPATNVVVRAWICPNGTWAAPSERIATYSTISQDTLGTFEFDGLGRDGGQLTVSARWDTGGPVRQDATLHELPALGKARDRDLAGRIAPSSVFGAGLATASMLVLTRRWWRRPPAERARSTNRETRGEQ